MGAERCYLIDLEGCNDANQYHQEYGGEKLRERVEKAKRCPLENVTTLNDYKQELRDFYLNGYKKGYQIDKPNFDDIFSTYTSQYIVVTGIPSHGKSNFVDEMCIGYNLKYGWKTAFASPENVPQEQHGDSIAQRVYGRKPETLQELNSLKWLKVEDYIEKNFYNIDFERYSLEETLEKAAELVKRKGIKCLVIDPFNKIKLKSGNKTSITEYTNEYLNEIDIFCKKYDILILLVAHPTKMEKDASGKRVMPDFYSIKGGGEWYDMSPNGLCIHRHFEENYIEVKVLKVKFRNLGENNASCYFAWNNNNGRYTPIDVDRYKNDGAVTYDNSFWLEEENEQPELIPEEMPVNSEFDLQGDPDCPF